MMSHLVAVEGSGNLLPFYASRSKVPVDIMGQ